MFNLSIDASWDVEQLFALFAKRRFDPTFPSNFSDLTPWSVESCVERVQAGRYLFFKVLDGEDIAAFHMLHDQDAAAGECWVSGYVMPTGRGRSNLDTYYKASLWETAKNHILYKVGYRRIYAYIIKSGGARHWAELCCKLTPAGTMRGAVPENETMADIIVYCHDPADVSRCRASAERLFPEGHWA